MNNVNEYRADTTSALAWCPPPPRRRRRLLLPPIHPASCARPRARRPVARRPSPPSRAPSTLLLLRRRSWIVMLLLLLLLLFWARGTFTSPRRNSWPSLPLARARPSDHRGARRHTDHRNRRPSFTRSCSAARAQSSPSPSVRLFHSLLQWHRHQLHLAQPRPYRNMFLLAAGPSDAPALHLSLLPPMLLQSNCLS
jgi:hypothetical protein